MLQGQHEIPFKSPDELDDFIVIDLETTGLTPESDKIIQLSAVHYVDHVEVENFSSFVNPNCHIPEMISRMTGITDNTVLSSPSIDDILPKYISFLSKSKFVTGYNIKFDLTFLSYAVGQDIEEFVTWFDTMILFRRAVKLDRYRLSDACEYIGYYDNFHNALCDCRACGAVLNYLCKDNRLDHALYSKAERLEALALHISKKETRKCCLDINDVSPNGPLFGKGIVFTGELSFGRNEAIAMAEKAGAVVKSSVSKKISYLVVGTQDEVLVGCDGKSNKEEKAYALISAGYDIRILKEREFLDLLQQHDELRETVNV